MPPARPGPDPGTDAGFTLVEVLVSIAVIGIMMTALTTFFVSTVAATGRQGHQQMAVQLATDAAERARSIKSSAVLGGRDRISTDHQWASPVAGVGPYLADMVEVWDGEAVFPAGASAPLPTSPRMVTLNNVEYGQHWYVGACWQPAAGGGCGPVQVAGAVRFYRVVIAVTWADHRCAGSSCGYVTVTLLNSASRDPVFNPGVGAQPPTVHNPGAQTGEVSVPASLPLTATGGAPPLIWSAGGLPNGLTMSSNGLISGTPTTAGTFGVSIAVTDGFTLIGTAAFDWVIKALPVLTSPGDQTSTAGTALTLPIPITGGVTPLTWSVAAPGAWGPTGLPPGLTLDPGSGVITGTPTTLGPAKPVTVQVTDANGKSASVTFTWTVPPLQQPVVAAQSSPTATAISPLQLTTTGGVTPYTWVVTDLPAGLSATAAGVITGTPTAGTRYLVTATVTDHAGSAKSVTFSWAVPTGTGLRVTAPTGDRTGDQAGRPVSLTATATGGTGNGTFSWAATGLPSGLTITPAGLVSGTPDRAGAFTVRLTVTDSVGKRAVFMFLWTIT